MQCNEKHKGKKCWKLFRVEAYKERSGKEDGENEFGVRDAECNDEKH